ncbi:hypothetical protein CBR_g5659 [Chara braunii]|uniref:Uncharacterized protein n=1 Tax=Chara braunii TaxID=69332 RepID=A0A388JRS2_CHABU|nr:hypothetical protein CBR_g5659 [Chara braunii]|eukprot:GBG60485.1 hypothetical protein CBR_g5659 [Chara braunii]
MSVDVSSDADRGVTDGGVELPAGTDMAARTLAGVARRPVYSAIVQKLTDTLRPVRLLVEDQSHLHAGHVGMPADAAGAETHFRSFAVMYEQRSLLPGQLQHLLLFFSRVIHIHSVGILLQWKGTRKRKGEKKQALAALGCPNEHVTGGCGRGLTISDGIGIELGLGAGDGALLLSPQLDPQLGPQPNPRLAPLVDPQVVFHLGAQRNPQLDPDSNPQLDPDPKPQLDPDPNPHSIPSVISSSMPSPIPRSREAARSPAQSSWGLGSVSSWESGSGSRTDRRHLLAAPCRWWCGTRPSVRRCWRPCRSGM